MKIRTCTFLSLTLLSISLPSFADKVVITGDPVTLEQRGDVYYVPSNYVTTTTTAYHYVSIGGKNSICYPEQQPNLASLDMQVINVNIGGKQSQWTCYNYDDNYFTVTP